ncbi:MAG: DNA recombination protein RmuC [Balneolaceae bacterium]
MELSLVITGILFLLIGYGFAYFISRSNLSRLEERNSNISDLTEEMKETVRQETERANRAEKELVKLNADYQNLKERLQEQKKELEDLQDKFRNEFKNLANEILEEKTKKFTEHNQENMNQLLKPLGVKIEEFRQRVEETHKEGIKGRSALDQHLKSLQELNLKMSEEAKNLTKALKGDTKQQGNWGEVILQRILEKSGLEKGREYHTQESTTTEDGRRLQPDVVVHLPDEKKLIVDSKVSLTHYEKYSSAENPADQNKALKQHINSLRVHVKGLSAKNYQNIHGFNSPDFILMFIPIEPAFGLAMQQDPDLYNEAFEKNIIIVSPTTLLATLATIDNVWKQEYQNKNAMDIAARGGALYDKFVLFVESLEDVGNRIQQTQKSYDEALNRLNTGSGNLVRQAEMLRELGAKVSKKLPNHLIDNHPDNGEE